MLFGSGGLFGGGSSGGIVQPAALVASGQSSLVLSNAIPANAKRITVNMYGIRQSSTGVPLIQFSTGGVFQVTGYQARSYYVNPTINLINSTAGFLINSVANSNDFYGAMTFTRVDPAAHKWVGVGKFNDGLAAAIFECAGGVDIGAAVDGVRLYIDGTQTFTAGTTSVMIE